MLITPDRLSTQTPGLEHGKNTTSDSRADFMKRFFSVAVSVGFASKIGNLNFLSSMSAPTSDELHQTVLLISAMTVVVGSWEFYFRSIDPKPLVDLPRFIVDIGIVSLYIALLLSTGSLRVFLIYLLAIMFLYIVWDILSMYFHPSKYSINNKSAFTVFLVYVNGAMDTGQNQDRLCHKITALTFY